MAEDQVNSERDVENHTQQMAGLTWILCEAPVSADVITEHEHALGIIFPDDFRAVIQKCPGGQPVERRDFWINHPGYDGRIGSGLGGLVSLGPLDDYDSMLANAEALHERFGVSRKLIPIALDGGGDYMCLDYRESESEPKIVYWSYGAIPDVG